MAMAKTHDLLFMANLGSGVEADQSLCFAENALPL